MLFQRVLCAAVIELNDRRVERQVAWLIQLIRARRFERRGPEFKLGLGTQFVAFRIQAKRAAFPQCLIWAFWSTRRWTGSHAVSTDKTWQHTLDEQHKTWRGFRGNGVTGGTIIELARNNGYGGKPNGRTSRSSANGRTAHTNGATSCRRVETANGLA
jgi:hypothetical protein